MLLQRSALRYTWVLVALSVAVSQVGGALAADRAGPTIKTAWRERISREPDIMSFDVGNIQGTGQTCLVYQRGNRTSGTTIRTEVVASRWDKRRLRRIWTSDTVSVGFRTPYCRVVRGTRSASVIVVSDGEARPEIPTFYLWAWSGTTFVPLRDVRTHDQQPAYQVYEPVTVVDPVGGPDGGVMLLTGLHPAVADEEMDITRPSQWQDEARSLQSIRQPDQYGGIAAADFDGDGKVEFALPTASTRGARTATIALYSEDGTRRQVTEGTYEGRLTWWQPKGAKLPYLVVSKCLINPEGLRTAGYLCLLQWTGGSFEEVWQSEKMDSAVVDFQVGDLKHEGQDGLLVLTCDRKGSYITKLILVDAGKPGDTIGEDAEDDSE